MRSQTREQICSSKISETPSPFAHMRLCSLLSLRVLCECRCCSTRGLRGRRAVWFRGLLTRAGEILRLHYGCFWTHKLSHDRDDVRGLSGAQCCHVYTYWQRQYLFYGIISITVNWVDDEKIGVYYNGWCVIIKSSALWLDRWICNRGATCWEFSVLCVSEFVQIHPTQVWCSSSYPTLYAWILYASKRHQFTNRNVFWLEVLLLNTYDNVSPVYFMNILSLSANQTLLHC